MRDPDGPLSDLSPGEVDAFVAAIKDPAPVPWLTVDEEGRRYRLVPVTLARPRGDGPGVVEVTLYDAVPLDQAAPDA